GATSSDTRSVRAPRPSPCSCPSVTAWRPAAPSESSGSCAGPETRNRSAWPTPSNEFEKKEKRKRSEDSSELAPVPRKGTSQSGKRLALLLLALFRQGFPPHFPYARWRL